MLYLRNLSLVTTACLLLGSNAIAQQLSDDEYKASTDSVLAALLGTTPILDPEAEAESFRNSLQDLVGDAVESGKSDDYISALMQEATDSGSLIVPDAMLDNEGEIDTAMLLQAAVSAAIAGTENAETTSALATEANTSQSDTSQGSIVTFEEYKVRPGDTLSRIAFKYYNDSLAYPRILNENRDNISNANRISVGQILRIPLL